MSRDTVANSEAASTPDSDASPTEDDPSKSSQFKRKNSKSGKPRLTADQKNDNHKEAENKRRNAIRERFTDLSRIVPDTVGQERSEQVMLTKTTAYLKSSMDEIRELELMAQQQGRQTRDAGRLRDVDYGGPSWKRPNLARYEKQKAKKAAKRPNGPDDADGEAEDDV